MATGSIVNTFISQVNWPFATAVQPGLQDGAVHVWRIRISSHLPLLAKLSTLLNEDEKLRGSKYLHERDRNRFIVSRAAQRIILGRYLNVAPAQLKFILGDNKKPFVIAVDGDDIQYNLSHSGDWILLAVSKLTVGSDVEYIDPDFDFNDILPEHFSEAEADYIRQQNKAERFYKLWTRKEALLKATGQGLGEHLRHTPASDGKHQMHPSLSGNRDDWSINTFEVAGGYIGSIAVKGLLPQLQFWGDRSWWGCPSLMIPADLALRV